jgi:DNA modification methylase
MIENASVDLVFCDLPYGETSCKWDSKIDLEAFWIEINRITKPTTPIFFTTTTRYGAELIASNPKNFRYDLVWVKSASCGFLNAKKMPMRKHEMIYVFYRKLPYYDLSSHKHKFLGHINVINPNCYNKLEPYEHIKYEPPLPVSVLKEAQCYGKDSHNYEYTGKAREANVYEPPLPNSVIRDTTDYTNNSELYGIIDRPDFMRKNGESVYDPPLPTSVITTKLRDNVTGLYGDETKKIRIYENGKLQNTTIYDPPLPVSVVKLEDLCIYDVNANCYGGGKEGRIKITKNKEDHSIKYEPPLPNSVLEIQSQKGKHSTQKPVELMKWILKYYSKENDVVLDPAMGSGSMGVACKEMNRKFIGIEKNEDIFKYAVERIHNTAKTVSHTVDIGGNIL